IRCKTKYQLNGKVKFTIAWKENRSEWSIYSDRSVTSVINAFLKKNNRPNSNLSGVYIFGFDIGRLHEYRLKIIDAPIILTNKRKRPLAMIQTISGQNKRFAFLGRESGKA
ncbi:2491_t:CDS:2, partial [Funneliformis caledonium]